MKTLTKILLVIGIITLIFTGLMIFLFIKYQTIPDVLVERYFTCVVGECGATAIIQVTKEIMKYKNKDKDKDNKEECTENSEELSDLAESVITLEDIETKGDED